MNAFAVISICFSLVILWVWTYEPLAMIEHKDGRVIFEHIMSERTSNGERLRVIFALVLMWVTVLMITYHELAWSLLQEYMKYKF